MERNRLTVGRVVVGLGRLRLIRRPWPGTARVSSQVQSRKQDGEFLCFLARSGTPVAYLKRPGFFVFPTAGKRSAMFPASGKWSDAGTKNPAGEGGAGARGGLDVHVEAFVACED